MSLADFNWHPSNRQLRQFAGICIGLIIVYSVFGGRPAGLGSGLAAAVACCVIGWLAWRRPQTLRPLFVGLACLAFPIGWLIGECALLAIYGFVFVPLGLVLRLLGRDGLERTIEAERESYWQPRTGQEAVESYYRPF